METKINYFEIPEIQVSYKDPFTASRLQIKKATDVCDFFKKLFENCLQHHEEAYALYLSQNNKVLGVAKIAQGSVSEVSMSPLMIFQIALKVNASRIIVTHNHPSGSLQPSDADIKFTNRLVGAAKLLDLKLLDHIIISDAGYYSFRDDGLI